MNKKIETLANHILENSGVYRKYSDEDLANAMLIFVEPFMAKMHDAHKNKLNQEQLEKLAEEAGKSLRQTVLLFTNVDLHKAIKGEETKGNK